VMGLMGEEKIGDLTAGNGPDQVATGCCYGPSTYDVQPVRDPISNPIRGSETTATRRKSCVREICRKRVGNTCSPPFDWRLWTTSEPKRPDVV
jgi:hypothetical protein